MESRQENAPEVGVRGSDQLRGGTHNSDSGPESVRQVALRLLSGDYGLSRKAGQFLGQCAVDDTPLTEKQAEWLKKMQYRADVIDLEGGA